MNPKLAKFIGAALNGFTKKNLNPKESPSTAVTYAGVGALALMSSNPPMTEYDALIQAAIAGVSLFCFYRK